MPACYTHEPRLALSGAPWTLGQEPHCTPSHGLNYEATQAASRSLMPLWETREVYGEDAPQKGWYKQPARHPPMCSIELDAAPRAPAAVLTPVGSYGRRIPCSNCSIPRARTPLAL